MKKTVYEDGTHNISNDSYHASEGLSRSALMRFKKSPQHYWYEYESGLYQRPEPTPAFVLGDVVHTLVLEPEMYDQRYVTSPKFDRRTNAGKEAHQAFVATSAGRTVLSEDIAAQSIAMASSVRVNELAQELLVGGLVEQSIYWTHEATGIQLKARPDSWSGHLIVDLKTSVDASARAFQSSAWNYGYYLQSAFISEALKSIDIEMEKFVFLVVEKEPPYATAIYMLDEDALDFGIVQLNELMRRFKQCQNSGDFPGYGVQTLKLPGWAKFGDGEEE